MHALTLDELKAWGVATQAMQKAAAGDPTRRVDLNFRADSLLAAEAAKLDRLEFVRSAIHDAGMTTSQYIVTTFAYLEAETARRLVDSLGAAAMPREISRRNVQFVRDNAAVIQRLVGGP